MDIQQAIFVSLLNQFRHDGIEFAFPTRVILHKNDGGRDGE
jgi:hypothetical protein